MSLPNTQVPQTPVVELSDAELARVLELVRRADRAPAAQARPRRGIALAFFYAFAFVCVAIWIGGALGLMVATFSLVTNWLSL